MQTPGLSFYTIHVALISYECGYSWLAITIILGKIYFVWEQLAMVTLIIVRYNVVYRLLLVQLILLQSTL